MFKFRGCDIAVVNIENLGILLIAFEPQCPQNRQSLVLMGVAIFATTQVTTASRLMSRIQSQAVPAACGLF